MSESTPRMPWQQTAGYEVVHVQALFHVDSCEWNEESDMFEVKMTQDEGPDTISFEVPREYGARLTVGTIVPVDTGLELPEA